MKVPKIQLVMNKTAYAITMPDGFTYCVSFGLWMEMLNKAQSHVI